MTSKLKCPVCQQDLGIILCDLDDFFCPGCKMWRSEKLWKALIQTKEELKDCQHNYSVKSEQHERGYAYATKTIKDLESKLEIAKNGLCRVITKTNSQVVRGFEYIATGIVKVAKDTLKQIEHKE